MPEKLDKYPYETATTEQKELGSYWWCIHHGRLIENLMEPIESRVHFIEYHKLSEERDCRLKNMAPVLRPDLLPKALREASKTWSEAYRVWSEASKARSEASKARSEANQVWDEAYRVWSEANQVWDEAYRVWSEASKACKKELEAQHKLEYPDSTWSEGSIFDR